MRLSGKIDASEAGGRLSLDSKRTTKYSPHGTRTTGSTRLNEMGYRPDAIEAQLAHAEPNSVRRTYNHATYLDERRAMMQAWAGKLDEWKAVAQTKLD